MLTSGATVMVSNVIGEIHGPIPTTSHCGTAMTGIVALVLMLLAPGWLN
jgi:hypothetical protein